MFKEIEIKDKAQVEKINISLHAPGQPTETAGRLVRRQPGAAGCWVMALSSVG